MIGRLRGLVVHCAPPLMVVDVQGVGYEVETPLGTFAHLPSASQPVQLFTHLMVREDAHALFGFMTEAERGVFRQLLKITGVGPRLALALLSGMTTEELALAVVREDIGPLTRVPGVGKKTAQRLLLELKGKLEVEGSPSVAASGLGTGPGVAREVEEALGSLGYHEREIRHALGQLSLTQCSVEEAIRLALKQMMSGRGA